MKNQHIQSYVQEHYEELLSLLRRLCAIPAPSHHEQARAEFCKTWLETRGAQGVYIDDALNVIYPLGCEGSREITVLAAHTDTVFPDLEPLPLREDDENIYCPGVGDDTASLAVLLMTAKYLTEQIASGSMTTPKGGLLFVCNSCEEGLGNLKGTRQLMQDYADRISRFITFDSNLHIMNTQCVGSHRYRVTVKTQGGHSFQAFGKPNAIALLSQIVSRIYEIAVPQLGSARTSYNVGIIQGGTSVNTIAQEAQMLCEYRSDNADCLAIMEQQFDRIFRRAAEQEGCEILVERIGERPCAATVDHDAMEQLTAACRNVIESVIQTPATCKSASTDCNIPLSLGIPAVCIGVYRGGGSHTREEWVEKESLKQGLEVAIRLVSGWAL